MTDLDADFGRLARARLAAASTAGAGDAVVVALAIRLAETQETLRPAARPRRRLLWSRHVAGTKRDGVDSAGTGTGGDDDDAVVAVAEAGDTCSPGSADSLGLFATALSFGARAANEAGQGGVRVLTLSAPDEATTDTPARCLIALLAPAPVSALLPPCAGESESARAHHARALENRLRGADLMADRIAALASLCPSEIAAIAGAIVEARRFALTLAIDSVAAAAAALVAREIDGSSPDGLLAVGPAADPAYARALRALSLAPITLPKAAAPPLWRLPALLDRAAALFRRDASAPSPA